MDSRDIQIREICTVRLVYVIIAFKNGRAGGDDDGLENETRLRRRVTAVGEMGEECASETKLGSRYQ